MTVALRVLDRRLIHLHAGPVLVLVSLQAVGIRLELRLAHLGRLSTLDSGDGHGVRELAWLVLPRLRNHPRVLLLQLLGPHLGFVVHTLPHQAVVGSCLQELLQVVYSRFQVFLRVLVEQHCLYHVFQGARRVLGVSYFIEVGHSMYLI